MLNTGNTVGLYEKAYIADTVFLLFIPPNRTERAQGVKI